MDIDRYIERIPMMGERVEDAKRRMAQVWNGQEPDYLPLIIGGQVPAELSSDIPSFNLREAYEDPDKMLCNAIPGLLSVALSPGDAIPSIRADMGCGIFPTLLGAKNQVFETIRPWVTGHVSKDVLSKMTPDDIDPYSGDFGRGLDYMAYFKEKLDGRAYVFTMDVQGPIDTAHQVLGDQFFYELYDDPRFVHHLLGLCVEVIVKGIKACKAVNGEPLDKAYHYNGLYCENGGIKTSEDTSTLLSEEHLEEFFVPYTSRLLKEFKGGWVHFCGSNPHLYKLSLEMPLARGLNFGNPERHNPSIYLGDHQTRNKVYYGGVSTNDGSPTESYYRICQMLNKHKSGLILAGSPVDGSSVKAVEVWRRAQESCLC